MEQRCSAYVTVMSDVIAFLEVWRSIQRCASQMVSQGSDENMFFHSKSTAAENHYTNSIGALSIPSAEQTSSQT
eukprot:scaffold3684_cov71-Skeletonema_dohrnii-CCMP3373.AAC.1